MSKEGSEKDTTNNLGKTSFPCIESEENLRPNLREHQQQLRETHKLMNTMKGWSAVKEGNGFREGVVNDVKRRERGLKRRLWVEAVRPLVT